MHAVTRSTSDHSIADACCFIAIALLQRCAVFALLVVAMLRISYIEKCCSTYNIHKHESMLPYTDCTCATNCNDCLPTSQCISDYTSVQLDKRTEDMHRRVLMAKIDEDTFKGMDHNQVLYPFICTTCIHIRIVLGRYPFSVYGSTTMHSFG
jgi:hypothetical protein